MTGRFNQLILAWLVVFASTWSISVNAGECRPLLRPLLLQTSPDKQALQRVEQICHSEAESGDPDSEYHLSLFYLGLTDWNVEKAVPMIENAARSGVAEAQYWLAWQYDAGPLLPDDTELARHWYERAGERDHRLALERLAEAYEDGDLGLPVDGRKASLLRARAARCENNTG